MTLRITHDGASDSDLLTADQALAMLPGSVSRSTLMRWAAQGKVPSIQLVPRGRRYFKRADILALLEPQAAHDDVSAQEPLPGLGDAS